MLSTAVNCQPGVRCVSCTWASACSQRRSTVNLVCGEYPEHGPLHALNGAELPTWCAVRILHIGFCMLSTAVNCQPDVRYVSCTWASACSQRRSTVNLVCGAYPHGGQLSTWCAVRILHMGPACSQRRSNVNLVCCAYPAHGPLHALNGGKLLTWSAVRTWTSACSQRW